MEDFSILLYDSSVRDLLYIEQQVFNGIGEADPRLIGYLKRNTVCDDVFIVESILIASVIHWALVALFISVVYLLLRKK